jgi:hypothetical protein
MRQMEIKDYFYFLKLLKIMDGTLFLVLGLFACW